MNKQICYHFIKVTIFSHHKYGKNNFRIMETHLQKAQKVAALAPKCLFEERIY